MTVDEIFSKLCAHMRKGLMIHDQISNAYNFLNLCGYSECHKFHYFEENCTYKMLQDYYLDHYYKLIEESMIDKPEIIPANWYKYTKHDVNSSEKRNAVKTLMQEWVNWEKETKKELETYYKELYDMNEIHTALMISCMLKDVDKELKHAQEKYINLETIGYDINVIIGEQKMLKKKYEEKITYINMKKRGD